MTISFDQYGWREEVEESARTLVGDGVLEAGSRWVWYIERTQHTICRDSFKYPAMIAAATALPLNITSQTAYMHEQGTRKSVLDC